LASEALTRSKYDADAPSGFQEEGVVEGNQPDIGADGFITEAIILRTGRPVLEIFQDEAELKFTDPESEIWRDRLKAASAQLMPAIRAVGRIEIRNGMTSYWVGTGWLLKPDIIVTNSHVASLFTSYARELVFQPGLNASIDFLEENRRSSDELTFALRRPLYVEDLTRKGSADLAFFQLDRIDQVEPIRLSGVEARPGNLVAVIGYPARNYLAGDQALVEQLFGDIFDKKRLAPGQITGFDSARILHDCTTSGGNSGSVLFDFNAGEAVGLHAAGRPFEANFAVQAQIVRDRLERLDRSRPATEGKTLISFSTKDSMNSITVTIPIRVHIEVGAPESANMTAPAPSPGRKGADRAGEFAEVLNEAPPQSYIGREGYQRDFLDPAVIVPLPAIIRDSGKILEFDFAGEKQTELRYEHFSVVMNRERRLCFFSAVNIDGKHPAKSPRPGWQWDSRISKEFQIKDECYGNPPKFSRGHMTRREDPIWGPPDEAALGNKDSMHVTNTVPQMQAFNAPVWLELEDYALKNAKKDKMRISVITGPVFSEDDPDRFGVLIPIFFWKIIVFIHDQTGKLSATGYVMDQKDFVSENEFVFGRLKTYQRSLKSIEEMAGLSFQDLTEHDRFEEPESGVVPELRSLDQIRF
jgi:endonuclease G